MTIALEASKWPIMHDPDFIWGGPFSQKQYDRMLKSEMTRVVDSSTVVEDDSTILMFMDPSFMIEVIEDKYRGMDVTHFESIDSYDTFDKCIQALHSPSLDAGTIMKLLKYTGLLSFHVTYRATEKLIEIDGCASSTLQLSELRRCYYKNLREEDSRYHDFARNSITTE